MKIAFLFSGQGSQYTGMMKDLADECPEVKEIFDIADKALSRKVSDLCFEGTQEELNLTHNTQPCVLAADLAAYAAVMAAGIKPEAVAGFSLGEYAALVAAGVMPLDKVFTIVQKRADFMQEAVPVGKGAMAAITKSSVDEVLELCDMVDGYVAPANYNCPGQIVVSGENSAVDQILQMAKEKKIRAVKLAVSAPFHCEMMNPAVEKLKESLSEIIFAKPKVPVYMNIDAQPETSEKNILDKLLLQAKSPVRWEETIKNMYSDGIDTFIELGPGSTLSKFVKKTIDGEAQIFNVTDLESLNQAVKSLRG